MNCSKLPESAHALCRLKFHLQMFYIITGSWFVSSIFLTSLTTGICIQSPFFVHSVLNNACSLHGAAATFSWMLFITSLATAFFLHTQGIVYGFDIDIAAIDVNHGAISLEDRDAT